MPQTDKGKALEIVEVKISELKPALYNPRKISDKDFAHLNKEYSPIQYC